MLLRCVSGLDATSNFCTVVAFGDGDIVLALEVEPELGAVTEIAAEAEGRIGGNRAAGIEDIGNAAGWDAEIERQAVSAQASRLEFAPKQAAGMSNRCHGLTFVIVGNFNFMGIALSKLETNPPAGVDCHGPLTFPIALKLMKANAF